MLIRCLPFCLSEPSLLIDFAGIVFMLPDLLGGPDSFSILWRCRGGVTTITPHPRPIDTGKRWRVLP